MATGLVYDERFLAHEAPYHHPEDPVRLRAIWSRLQGAGLPELCERVPAREATRAELLAVHTERLVDLVDLTAANNFWQIDPDTYTCQESALAARLAAGGVLDLTLRVARGELANGFALVRPPGHHAESARSMGFCLFNNVAVAARAAQQAGVGKIAIVDWDLHHGNGTQEIFYDDPSILYLSTHQFPHYPGTGTLGEVGAGAGRGFTLNVPWPGGMGDADYVAVFDEVLLPVLRQFEPELVLVSAGFDAADGDPLGGMEVSVEGFAWMTGRLGELAQGRMVLALEGGYNLEMIAESTVACLRVLLGEPAPALKQADAVRSRPLLERARQAHRQFWPVL